MTGGILRPSLPCPSMFPASVQTGPDEHHFASSTDSSKILGIERPIRLPAIEIKSASADCPYALTLSRPSLEPEGFAGCLPLEWVMPYNEGARETPFTNNHQVRLLILVIQVIPFPASSCSQMRSTLHPAAQRVWVTSLSRRLFVEYFVSQKSRLLAGRFECWGHPCQKQPSTKPATRFLRKMKSAFRISVDVAASR